MDDRSKRVLSALQTLCARREYCSLEMHKKALERLDGDETAAGDVLAALVADSFVNDGRYAAAFAREKAALGGWGPVKIRFALKAKGISSETINAALSEIDASRAGEKLKRLLCAKKKTLEGDPQQRLKLLRFALGRGYEYDSVVAVLEDIDREEDC